MQSGVSYIVVHQCMEEKYKVIPKALMRPDVLVDQVNEKGLSKSRNRAIALADADIAIIADDDVEYLENAFDTITKVFSSDKSIDIACFKIRSNDELLRYKDYPKHSYTLNKLRLHYISSIEIAFRIEPVREKNIMFDPLFGLGSDFFVAGEEEAFIQDCIKNKMLVKFFPIETVIHPFESSTKGISPFDQKKVRIVAGLLARKSILNAVFSTLMSPILLLPKFIKYRKNPMIYIIQCIEAIKYIHQNRK